MSRIKSKNTLPELAVRKALNSLKIKYKFQGKNLPGRPDLIVPHKEMTVFVNGCFWHQHKHNGKVIYPKSNTEYWKPKLRQNVEKQKNDFKQLRKLGWKPAVIWECQIKNKSIFNQRIQRLFA